jgi:cytosine/creatinine deaminase
VRSWITNGRLTDGRLVDVEIDSATGTIVSVETAAAETAVSNAVAPRQGINLHGDILSVAPMEPHAHLDKVLTAQLVPNPKGDLMGAIQGWTSFFPSLTVADMVARATQATQELVASGVTAIRTHVNVHEGMDLKAMEALLQVRADLGSIVDIEVVSLTGWVTGESSEARRLLRESALMDPSVVVGGCPHLDVVPNDATDIALDLAGELGRKIDLHTDENLEPHSEDLRYLAERILATGYTGAAAASHCCSLGMQDLGRQADTAAIVTQAGVAVIALPQTNLFLQSRDHAVAPPRGITAVHTLRAAGAVVAAGADNVRDPFNSMGRHDPCETAALMVMAGHLIPGEAWDSVTTLAAQSLGLGPRSIAVGQPADLVSLAGADLGDAISRADQARRVWKRGRLVAETLVSRSLFI